MSVSEACVCVQSASRAPLPPQLKIYRFSIAWTRVLPTANASEPNPAGVAYYHRLIDAILDKSMVPFVSVPSLPRGLQMSIFLPGTAKEEG